jgi:hypothetical protein
VTLAQTRGGQSIEPTVETHASVMNFFSDVHIFQRQAFFFAESLDSRISIFSASKIQRKFSVETQQYFFAAEVQLSPGNVHFHRIYINDRME